jgi:rhodanese-related sulfurtransferase
LAQKLIEEGYKKIYVLKGGWREWYESKFPVEAI